VALSAAHAAVKFFGTPTTFQAADQALAKAMRRAFAPEEELLSDYVAALGDGQECVEQAVTTPLGPARVELVGDVAIVQPGTGALQLPVGAKAVAIDVRGLPSAAIDAVKADTGLPDLDPVRLALGNAAALALASPVQRPVLFLTLYFGLPDGDPAEPDAGLFTTFRTFLQSDPIAAGAPAELPLAVLTSERLSNGAAEFAASLRLANRAWIFGSDVYAAAAESTWAPVGNVGIAFRQFNAFDPASNQRWPDVIPADVNGADPVALSAGLSARGMPPAAQPSSATRPTIQGPSNFGTPQPASTTPGEVRAALVSLHGTFRQFFFDFADVGDFIDGRLEETLALVDIAAAFARGPNAQLDRDLVLDVIRRFGNALNDGHNFNIDEARPFLGYLPIVLEHINGMPVVRRSGLPNVHAGDTIVRIDGVPSQTWFAAQGALTSASTERYRFFVIVHHTLQPVHGPRTFGLVDVLGRYREETVQAPPNSNLDSFGTAPVVRGSGFLADLGAPDVFYLNMTSEVSASEVDALAAIGQGASARAMIVDMRGYPHGDHYLVDSALMPEGFLIPNFVEGLPVSPGQTFFLDEGAPNFGPAAGPPTYAGPLVLLVGSGTVSAAENFSMMLANNGRPLHVVGQPTAGTNGTITGLQVLGQYAVSFTGERVRNADGSQFVGVGITPDILVPLAAQDFAAGRDPELQAALRTLQ
jgi:hypothetical protein